MSHDSINLREFGLLMRHARVIDQLFTNMKVCHVFIQAKPGRALASGVRAGRVCVAAACAPRRHIRPFSFAAFASQRVPLHAPRCHETARLLSHRRRLQRAQL
jgi:hypothetical protein